MTDTPTARETLWNLISHARFAMFTTREPGDVLRSRPMTVVQKSLGDRLWFFTARSSAVIRAVTSSPQVCLSFGNSSAADFVCVAGAASVVTDVQRKRELWSPMVGAWYPGGPESPDVVLIAVTIEHAEYWDSVSSKLVQLAVLASARVSGKPPTALGTHTVLAGQPVAGSVRADAPGDGAR